MIEHRGSVNSHNDRFSLGQDDQTNKPNILEVQYPYLVSDKTQNQNAINQTRGDFPQTYNSVN